jgi:threonine/homoserine/homoserine lactone efflux protein
LNQAIELTVAVFLLVLGMSYLLRYRHWLEFLKGAMQQPARLFPVALSMLIGGSFVGATYDDWTGTWPLFITVLAWLIALEGALLLIFPGVLRRLEKIPEHFLAWYLRGGGLLLIVLGAFLLRHWEPA